VPSDDLPKITPSHRPQPANVTWPTTTWPRGDASDELTGVVNEAFTLPALSESNAVIVIQGGRILVERYFGAKQYFDRPPEPITKETPLLSWSMAKSILHALVGLLVDEGRLDVAARAAVAEWDDPADPRHAISLRDLLAMRDGLDFVEDYVDGEISNTIEMLFGDGQTDTAGYTAARPLRHEPGTVFNYSSGTTNVISRIVADTVGYGDTYRAFMRDRLFGPLGMSSATPKIDDAGVFVASTFVHATAQDFARFGLLYLRGGEWDGTTLLSTAWVNTAQAALSVEDDTGNFYSWQWWVSGDEFGTYWANGYDGQMIAIAPALDAIVVRLGRTPAARSSDLRHWRQRVMRVLAV
jgi:CubicO group peptidase (beta-lactamase class C family)